MRSKSFLSVAIFAGLFAVGSVWAHDEHCHKKNADGSMTDIQGVDSQKACDIQGGKWYHHHAHCHKAGGTHADLIDAKTKSDCLAKNGAWEDHGHEAKYAE